MIKKIVIGFGISLLLMVVPVFAECVEVFNDKNFLTEGLFQVVATDLDEDGQREIMVAGKNYTTRELLVYKLNNQLEVVWQSSNLFEERSILWISPGKFNDIGQVLLVMTNTRFYLFKMAYGTMQLVKEYKHNLDPLNLTAGDIDGDGYDELLVTRVGNVTLQMYNCYLEILKFSNDSWETFGKTANLGNIRGLATGDLNGDGQAEVFVEEGLRVSTGNIRMLTYVDNKLTEVYKGSQLVKGAAYGMRLQEHEGKKYLMTASSRGKINFLVWEEDHFTTVGEEISAGGELIDAQLVNLDHDPQQELMMIIYPQQIKVFKQ